jgi:hypothetical protein
MPKISASNVKFKTIRVLYNFSKTYSKDEYSEEEAKENFVGLINGLTNDPSVLDNEDNFWLLFYNDVECICFDINNIERDTQNMLRNGDGVKLSEFDFDFTYKVHSDYREFDWDFNEREKEEIISNNLKYYYNIQLKNGFLVGAEKDLNAFLDEMKKIYGDYDKTLRIGNINKLDEEYTDHVLTNNTENDYIIIATATYFKMYYQLTKDLKTKEQIIEFAKSTNKKEKNASSPNKLNIIILRLIIILALNNRGLLKEEKLWIMELGRAMGLEESKVRHLIDLAIDESSLDDKKKTTKMINAADNKKNKESFETELNYNKLELPGKLPEDQFGKINLFKKQLESIISFLNAKNLLNYSIVESSSRVSVKVGNNNIVMLFPKGKTDGRLSLRITDGSSPKIKSLNLIDPRDERYIDFVFNCNDAFKEDVLNDIEMIYNSLGNNNQKMYPNKFSDTKYNNANNSKMVLNLDWEKMGIDKFTTSHLLCFINLYVAIYNDGEFSKEEFLTIRDNVHNWRGPDCKEEELKKILIETEEWFNDGSGIYSLNAKRLMAIQDIVTILKFSPNFDNKFIMDILVDCILVCKANVEEKITLHQLFQRYPILDKMLFELNPNEIMNSNCRDYKEFIKYFETIENYTFVRKMLENNYNLK